MDVNEFESIKRKVATLKEKNIRAQAALEAACESAKTEFGTDKIEELTAMITEKEELAELLQDKIDKQFDKLKGLTNWALV